MMTLVQKTLSNTIEMMLDRCITKFHTTFPRNAAWKAHPCFLAAVGNS